MPEAQQQQLMLWADQERVVLKSGRFRAARSGREIGYKVTQEGHRLTLEIRCIGGGRSNTAARKAFLRLDVGAGASCTIHKHGRQAAWRTEYHSWCLGISDDQGKGAFVKLQSWVLQYLMRQGSGPEYRYPELVEALREICVFTQRRALSLCDARLVSIARQFHRSIRLEVYGGLVRYGERFAQMAVACPGVIIMIQAIRRSNGLGFEKPALSAIDVGVPLAEVIDVTWKCWARERKLDVNDRTFESKVHKQLIKRAPAGIKPLFVKVPPPPGTDISDIPDDRSEREVWYRILGHYGCAVARPRHRAAAESSAQTLTGFFSRHALAVAEHAAQTGRSSRAVISEIVDYGLRSGDRVPSRRRSPVHVFRAIVGWHIAAWRRTEHAPQTPLAACEVCLPEVPLSVKALETVADLQKEARQMQHCIASYADEAVAGTVFVFRARFGNERLTIALENSGSRLSLQGVSGKRNKSASPPARVAIQAWLAGESDGTVEEQREMFDTWE